MSLADAYLELGLTPDASAAEAKAAWRRLVSRWHPDRNASPEAAAWVQRINGAYERIVAALAEGRAGGRAAAPPARVVRRRVRLSIEEAALGCTRLLRGRVVEPCGPCEGLGRLQALQACAACNGRGQVRVAGWFGWLPSWQSCEACEGHGEVATSCEACDGSGRQVLKYRRSVRFPPGVRAGDVLAADGGGALAGGIDAQFELEIALARHALFTVDDQARLCCTLRVDGWAWLAESWIEVPSLEGPQAMRLRRGRHVYRLRGQGLPRERGGSLRDDYLVTVQPVFPERLNPRQQALLEQLVAAGD